MAEEVKQNDEQDEPKDFSMKSKKLKPIPPPLDLNITTVEPHEFLASPRSPLYQKYLPFRKRRAYSWSIYDITNDMDTPPNSSTAPNAPANLLLPRIVTPVIKQEHISTPLLTPVETSPEFVPPLPTMFSYPRIVGYSRIPTSSPTYPWSPASPSPYSSQLSPCQWTTALLSPAPSQPSSSLGNSREELSDVWSQDSNNQNLRLVWGCFLSGTRLKFLQDEPTLWVTVDDLVKGDTKSLPYGTLEVRQIIYLTMSRTANSVVQLHFSPLSNVYPPILVECSTGHPFFVREKGWCSVCPELSLDIFRMTCAYLESGDICVQPQVSSGISTPDLCDSLKSFNFNPLESKAHDFLLSPPNSPTKKAKDTPLQADRPKRPMNAFMLYAKKHRLDLIQKHPGKDNRAISVLLGETWKTLPPEEKEMYSHQARTMADEQKRLFPDCWKRKRSQSTS